MIEILKILNEFDKINPEVIFEINHASLTRGSAVKLKAQRNDTIARMSYFSVRVVDHCNRLQGSVISYKTIDSFKSRLDKSFRDTSLP